MSDVTPDLPDWRMRDLSDEEVIEKASTALERELAHRLTEARVEIEEATTKLKRILKEVQT